MICGKDRLTNVRSYNFISFVYMSEYYDCMHDSIDSFKHIKFSEKKPLYKTKMFLLASSWSTKWFWMHHIKGIWHKKEKENYSKAVVSKLFWNVGSLKFLPGNETECNTQAYAHTKFRLFIHYEKEKSSKRDRWMYR